jgi:hypothetical protein
MTVSAQNDTVAYTLTPASVRYNLCLRSCSGVRTGTIVLQRSAQQEDGTWIDDSRPGGNVAIPLPAEINATGGALDAIEAIIIPAAACQGVTVDAPLGDYNATLNGLMLPRGGIGMTLDVQAALLVLVGGVQTPVTIQSLASFSAISANATVAVAIESAWSALDAALNAANATGKWV